MVCWSLSMSMFITGCLLLINWFRSVYYYLWTSSSWLKVCTYVPETAIGSLCLFFEACGVFATFWFRGCDIRTNFSQSIDMWLFTVLQAYTFCARFVLLGYCLCVGVCLGRWQQTSGHRTKAFRQSDKLLTFCNPRKEDTATYRLHIGHSYLRTHFFGKKKKSHLFVWHVMLLSQTYLHRVCWFSRG